MPDAYRWDNGDLLLTLHVQARAGRTELAGALGDALKVRVSAPPVDGKANAELVRFLAREFGVSRTAVELLAGETARRKRFRIRTPRRLPASIPQA